MSALIAAIPRKFISSLILLIAFCTLIVNADEDVTPSQKLEVKIYYETLCTDSIRFMRDQLLPSMTKKSRLRYADIKFVPFGHVFSYNDSKTNQKVLKCQHGINECELNAQHACIIENNSEQETFDMITCMMSGYNQKLDKCGIQFRVDLDAAKRCKQTRSIADILEKYGEHTYALNPSFVPAISIDGVFNWNEQEEILENFDAVFCRRYESKFNVKLNGC